MRIELTLALCLLGVPSVSFAEAPPKAWTNQPAHLLLDPIGEGRRSFLQLNCYGCHGLNASGGMGPDIQHAETGDVTEAVLQGEPDAGMRSFAGYATNTDAKNIAAYLQSIGTPQEPTWVDWWNPNP